MVRSASTTPTQPHKYIFWHECGHKVTEEFLIRTLSYQMKKLAKNLDCGHVDITTTQEDNKVGIIITSRQQEDIEKISRNLEENPIRIGKFRVKVKLPKKPLRKAWLEAIKELLNKKNIKYQIQTEYNLKTGKKTSGRTFLFNRETHATTLKGMVAENSVIEARAHEILNKAPRPKKPARKPHRSRLQSPGH